MTIDRASFFKFWLFWYKSLQIATGHTSIKETEIACTIRAIVKNKIFVDRAHNWMKTKKQVYWNMMPSDRNGKRKPKLPWKIFLNSQPTECWNSAALFYRQLGISGNTEWFSSILSLQNVEAQPPSSSVTSESVGNVLWGMISNFSTPSGMTGWKKN